MGDSVGSGSGHEMQLDRHDVRSIQYVQRLITVIAEQGGMVQKYTIHDAHDIMRYMDMWDYSQVLDVVIVKEKERLSMK